MIGNCHEIKAILSPVYPSLMERLLLISWFMIYIETICGYVYMSRKQLIPTQQKEST